MILNNTAPTPREARRENSDYLLLLHKQPVRNEVAYSYFTILMDIFMHSRVVSVHRCQRCPHKREILHIDPLLREVPPPQTQRPVLRRCGQNGACAVPRHAPAFRWRRDLHTAMMHEPPLAFPLAQESVDVKAALSTGRGHEMERAPHGGSPGQIVDGLPLRLELYLLYTQER